MVDGWAVLTLFQVVVVSKLLQVVLTLFQVVVVSKLLQVVVDGWAVWTLVVDLVSAFLQVVVDGWAVSTLLQVVVNGWAVLTLFQVVVVSTFLQVVDGWAHISLHKQCGCPHLVEVETSVLDDLEEGSYSEGKKLDCVQLNMDFVENALGPLMVVKYMVEV